MYVCTCVHVPQCCSQLSAMENAGLLQKVKAAEDGQAKERSRAVKAEVGCVVLLCTGLLLTCVPVVYA